MSSDSIPGSKPPSRKLNIEWYKENKAQEGKITHPNMTPTKEIMKNWHVD